MGTVLVCAHPASAPRSRPAGHPPGTAEGNPKDLYLSCYAFFGSYSIKLIILLDYELYADVIQSMKTAASAKYILLPYTNYTPLLYTDSHPYCTKPTGINSKE